MSELGFVGLRDDRIFKTMKYQELTHEIIGCAMKVHSSLGNGFQEVIYRRALVIEMKKQGLSFTREMEMEIFYDGRRIGTRRVDFFVEDKIMVELKALIKLEDVHLVQAMNYCQAYNLPRCQILRVKLEMKRTNILIVSTLKRSLSSTILGKS